jgi:hypothetical protein
MADNRNDLGRDELEWLSEIVYEYRDSRDWTHHEWGDLQNILDKLDAQLDGLT